MSQSSQKILFIAPKFFGYEQEIRNELQSQGHFVDWFDDRPSSTPLVKALIRFKPELIASYSDAYFDRIIEGAKSCEYDVVFVIKGEAFSAERIQALRSSQPKARFLYYSWDSLKNFKNSQEKLGLFDKVYSFDSDDCKTHTFVKHLPLFYISAYERIAESKLTDIDLLFLGSIHSDRFPVIQRIWAAAKSVLQNVKTYDHFYYQSKWVFALRKVFDAQFRNIPWSAVKWNSLNTTQTLELISRSKIIVDVHHPAQKGLTMRTIETFGAHKKLITTNQEVCLYDFYSANNILVVDRKSPVIPIEFLNTDYHALPNNIYQKYSLRSWLSEIFC